MSEKIKWGILGPGRISHKFVQGLQVLPDAEVFAIGSRSADRAQEFAAEYNAERNYGTYLELAQDPDVDIIYIATPHPWHYENTLMCLEHGKAVLCEKPFTMNRVQLTHLVEVARSKNLFLMEALWTRFHPNIEKILEIRKEGLLGNIRFVNADFGFKGEYDQENRLFNPELGGGALLDIGIYPVFLAMLLLGKPDKMQAISHFAVTGVDESTSMIFSYTEGKMANLSCTFKADTPTRADIIFDKGRIRLDRHWFTPSLMTIIDEDENVQEYSLHDSGNGYQYQAIECMKCLREGMTESPMMSLDFSLELMDILDHIRLATGIRYASDDIM